MKDGIQIRVCTINKESVAHVSQFISDIVKKNWRRSQAQFWEKLRKLRLRQNDGFLIKNVYWEALNTFKDLGTPHYYFHFDGRGLRVDSLFIILHSSTRIQMMQPLESYENSLNAKAPLLNKRKTTNLLNKEKSLKGLSCPHKPMAFIVCW